MLTEVLDNAIDESLAGFCKNIDVVLHEDDSASVLDDGRGIPVGIHKSEGISAAEVIMTQLHAGGKFSQDVYEVSGGLHGVGVSVVNALSKKLELKIYQNKHVYEAEFAQGATVRHITEIGSTKNQGTYIRFWPDPEIFSQTEFDYKLLVQRFRELAFLNPGVRISLHDRKTGERADFYDTGGIQAFAKYICGTKIIINKTPLVIKEKYNDVDIDCVIYWTKGYSENAQYFTNTIPQSDGGTHVAGLRAGLTKSFQSYVKDKGTKAQQKTEFLGEDIREGMCCVLSIKVADPKFASQTKEKLVSSNVRQAVEHVTTKYTSDWLEENPEDSGAIIQKIIDSAQARDAARKARDLSRKGKSDITFQVAKKLAGCSEKDPSKCQLFIVEGDSAGGSVKQARDRFTQAVLPLRGKILNIERVGASKALSSEMIATLVSAIGTGIMQDFDLQRLRYHRIVIMTDADVDGRHIEALLLTFFFRYMPQLIQNGHIYIAHPPLYGIVGRKGIEYLRDDSAFYRYIFTRGMSLNSIPDTQEMREFLHSVREVRRQ
jgi:DNA gyrase subunit B